MIFIYWIISIINISYLVMKKRNFDLFTIAIAIFIYYSSPAYLGYINLGGDIIDMKIVDKVYYFLIFVQVFFFIAIYIYDKFFSDKDKGIYYPSKFLVYSIFAFSILFFIIELLVSGIDTFLSIDKSEIDNSRFYSLAIWSALISLYLGIQYNYKKIGFTSFLILAFTLFVGSRAYFATALLIIILLALKENKMILVKKWRYILAGTISFVFLVFYKTIYKAIKTLDFSLILQSIKSSNLDNTAFFGEANAIMSNLNITVFMDFKQNQSEIQYIMQHVPLINELLPVEYTRYAHIISEYIHPSIGYGMGSSLWAELYSIFGYTGMFFGAVIWIILIFISNYLFQTNNKFIAFMLPAIVYVTFYTHRLDLSFVLSPFKTSILLLIISYLFYYIYFKPFIRIKKDTMDKDLLIS